MNDKIKEKIIGIKKRCPQCYELSLEFDVNNNMMVCKKCGFKQYIKR